MSQVVHAPLAESFLREVTAQPQIQRVLERCTSDGMELDGLRGNFVDKKVIARFSSAPDYGAAAPLDADALEELHGTTKPSHEMVPRRRARACAGSPN
jgi:hypothetical protein